MKHVAIFPLGRHQALKSGVKSLVKQSALLLALSFTLVGGVFSVAKAGSPEPVKELLDTENCSDIGREVGRLVKESPDNADVIIANAVKDHPPCACEIVKAGIQAITPEGGQADPKHVVEILSIVLPYVQYDAELVETVVQCATEASPAIGPQIPEMLYTAFNLPIVRGDKAEVKPGLPVPPENILPVTPDQVL